MNWKIRVASHLYTYHACQTLWPSLSLPYPSLCWSTVLLFQESLLYPKLHKGRGPCLSNSFLYRSAWHIKSPETITEPINQGEQTCFQLRLVSWKTLCPIPKCHPCSFVSSRSMYVTCHTQDKTDTVTLMQE